MSENVDLIYNGCYKVQEVANELHYLSKAHTALGNDKQAEDLCEMASTLMNAKALIKKAFSSELNRGLKDAASINGSILSHVISGDLTKKGVK